MSDLTVALLTIFGTVASVTGVVLYVFNGTKNLVKEIHETQKEIREMQKEIGETQKEISETQKEINETQKEISETLKGIRETLKGIGETLNNTITLIEKVPERTAEIIKA